MHLYFFSMAASSLFLIFLFSFFFFFASCRGGSVGRSVPREIDLGNEAPATRKAQHAMVGLTPDEEKRIWL